MARSLFFWPYGDAGICAEFRDEIRGAGIDERGPAGRGYPTCTIITMEANDLVTPTHYRMPGIPEPYPPEAELRGPSGPVR